MITESRFYGGSKDVSLTGDYTVDYRVARLWSFTPTASGHDVILPSPEGMKLGGIYFIIINHSDTYTLTIKDHDDNEITLLDTEEGCILSLSETEFTITPAMASASPPVYPILIGKWGLLGFPPIYTGSGGAPQVVAYWNYKVMALGEAEGYEAIRYFLFGGLGDLDGCDQFDGTSTWVTKSDIPGDHSGSWVFHPNIHYIFIAVDSDYLYKFRPTEDTWINECALVDAHAGGVAFHVGEYGYVLCGTARNTMESYYGRTWTRKRAHSYYTTGGSAAADPDTGYFTNGQDSTTGSGDNYHFQYDPVTDTWAQKDDLPDPAGRFNHSAFYIHEEGEYYVVGGQTETPTYYDDLDEWVPSTDTWTGRADLTAGNRALAAAASADFIGDGSGQIGIHFCGYNGSSQDDVYQYSVNSPSNQWTSLGTTPGSVNKSCPSAGFGGA